MSETAPAAEPTDDQRMRAAVELAGAHPSPSASAVLRDHRVSTIGRVLIVLIAAAVVGGFVGFLLGASRSGGGSGSPVPGWRVALGWVLWTVGVLGCIVSIVRASRSGGFRRGRSKPLQVLTTAQRRSLLRQIRQQEPVIEAQVPVARFVAGTIVDAAPRPWVSLSIIAVLAGDAIRSHGAGPWYLVGILAVLMAGGALLSRRLTGRARTFLAAHPAPAAGATRD